MAININQPNLSGLAAIAGRGSGNLNLGNIGGLGLKSLQLKQQQRQIDKELELRRLAIQSQDYRTLQQGLLGNRRMDLQNQQFNQTNDYRNRQLAMMQQQNQMNNALEQQKMGFNQQMAGARFGMEQQKFEALKQAKNEERAFEQMKLGVEQLAKQDKARVEKMGAFAAQVQFAMQNAQNPAEANQIRNESVQAAFEMGLIDKKQKKQFGQMPLSEFKANTDMLAMMTKHAGALIKSRQKSPDVNLRINPDGTVTYTSTATKQNISKNQEQYLDATTAMEMLEPYMDPPEHMFGLASLQHTGTQVAEFGKVIPGIGAREESKKKYSQFTEYDANASLNIMKTAKSLAGARFSDADLAMVKKIIPQVGLSHNRTEYLAKMKLVKNYMKQIARTREELLRTGKYELGTEEYTEAFRKKLPEIQQMVEGNKTYSNEIESAIESNMSKYNLNRDQVISIMEKNGMLNAK